MNLEDVVRGLRKRYVSNIDRMPAGLRIPIKQLSFLVKKGYREALPLVRRQKTSETWLRWYKTPMGGPERCFIELKAAVPSYVRNVIDFGCAAGRNLSVFEGSLRLHGVDIADKEDINWLIEPGSLSYIQSRLQDFAIERGLEDFLCISHGCIFYLDKRQQRRFLKYLSDKGCRNFIFQEYDTRTLYHDGYKPKGPKIGYPFENALGLVKTWFRSEIPAWIGLDWIPHQSRAGQ